MSDLIDRQAAIDATTETVFVEYEEDANKEESIIRQTKGAIRDRIKALPSAQSELEDKIRAIGYTGKEGRIYIGGRLFAVRELAQ